MALTDKPQEKLKAAAEEDDVTGALTTEEVSSKEYQAKRKGFRVDAKVFEKNQGAREGVYKIISIDDNVKLQEVDDFKTELLTLSLPFAKLLENWKLFLGEMPTYIKDDWAERYVGVSSTRVLELLRCKLFAALDKDYETNGLDDIHSRVRLCLKPTQIRSLQKFSPGELYLSPLVNKVTDIAFEDKSGHALRIEYTKKLGDGRTLAFFIHKQTQPTDPLMKKWSEKTVVNPFFWVGENSNETKCKMVMKTKVTDHWKIPYWTNSKVVNKDDVLLFFKPAPEKVEKLKDTERVTDTKDDDDDEEEEEGDGEPAAKRPRGRPKSEPKAMSEPKGKSVPKAKVTA